MNKRHNNPGFTLIEMLVALAMIAAIVSMVYGSYAAASRSMEIYDSRLTCAQRTDLVIRLMARQLRSAYVRPTEPNQAESGTARGNPVSGQAVRNPSPGAEVRMLKSRPPFLGGMGHARGEVLDFITTAGLSGGLNGSQRLARVSYRYDPSLKMLAVHSWPHADSAYESRSAGSWRPLLWQVTTMELEFYDGSDWQPQWDGKSNQKLPRALRIRLEVTDEKDRIYQCGTTVEILNHAARQKTAGEAR